MSWRRSPGSAPMACRRCRALGHFPWKWNTPRVMPVDQRVASNIEDVAKMDPDWAISEIDEFVRVTDQVAYDNRPGSGVVHFGTHMRGQAPRPRRGLMS